MYSYIIAKTPEHVNCVVKSQSNGCPYRHVELDHNLVVTNNQNTSFLCVLILLFVCYRSL